MREGNICETSSPRESREALREKGQFWTPAWVAEAMVEYVLPKGGGVLFDPAVGTGAFFRAAKKVAGSKRVPVRFAGMEIDPSVLERASESGISREDLSGVTIGDFVLHPPRAKFPAIAGNPPYIRHHRLPPEKKACLKALGAMITGESLDGRAGLHVYFLIRALSLLEKGGRLAFIVPADTCEGKFALQLWTWITANFALDAVITFSPEASPFPNIDTNPLILLIRHAPPNRKFLWARCVRQRTSSLREWIGSGCPPVSLDDLFSIERDLSEGLKTGFSRKPSPVHAGRYVLGDFVSVMRGIATGANRFFLMTAKQIREMKLPGKYFVRAIGRTRDIPDDEITDETLCRLERR
ncbi:MAG: SAM-dependent methyltransferase [Planctomycetota bacterium]|nr:SAM-dependent methyltransferase [Planctomycetota bacterium]